MNKKKLIEEVSKDADISLEKAEAAINSFFTRLTDEQISSYLTNALEEEENEKNRSNR